MKKLVIGCGVVVVVLLIGAGVASYVVYNKVRSTVAEFAALSEIPSIERGITNQTSFTPPESGELTASQLSRYLKVQQHVRSLLGTRFDEFQKQYAELSKRMDRDQGTVLDAPTIIAAYRDLARTYIDAKKAQVQAINTEAFSLSEYHWVRDQAYKAAGIPLADFDLARIIEEAQSGNAPSGGTPPMSGSFGPSGPDTNKTLVAPHKKTLEDNAALTFFGL
jgi:hypothetical protein